MMNIKDLKFQVDVFLRRHWETTLEEFINAAELTNKWIPVSERSPEKNDWYSCSTKYGIVLDLRFEDGKWIDYRRVSVFNEYIVLGYGFQGKKHEIELQEAKEICDWTDSVLAWKPLPELYIEE